MAFKDKPALTPEIEEWAASADKKPEAPAPQSVTRIANVQEARVQSSLRLAPSVQMRIKELALAMSKRAGERVTAQDLMERALLEWLKKEEQKFKA